MTNCTYHYYVIRNHKNLYAQEDDYNSNCNFRTNIYGATSFSTIEAAKECIDQYFTYADTGKLTEKQIVIEKIKETREFSLVDSFVQNKS